MAVQIFLVGDKSEDRTRVMKVLKLLEREEEWDGVPPAIEIHGPFDFEHELRDFLAP